MTGVIVICGGSVIGAITGEMTNLAAFITFGFVLCSFSLLLSPFCLEISERSAVRIFREFTVRVVAG